MTTATASAYTTIHELQTREEMGLSLAETEKARLADMKRLVASLDESPPR